MRRERDFQATFIDKVRKRFPEADIIKNDANYLQGFPDWTILYGKEHAVLEIKRSSNEPYQPNQEYYLGKFSGESFRETVTPENEEEILNRLDRRFNHGL